ncbi:MAG: hypothetical protein K0B37_06900 [Bacteroidales bacterium]|jgi:hypothetical protein|nr:hypothetical protein [Bacteroidales bacterium]
MDLREEFEGRVKKLENFIEDKGFGSKQLKKAKKVQRSINAVVFMGSLLTVAGIMIWALNRD